MPEPLKNMFNPQSVTALGEAIQSNYPAFDLAGFKTAVFTPNWESLELKQRMRHIATSLRPFLPADYGEALAILSQALPLLNEQSFEKMVFPDFVEVFGLDDYETSIPALEYFTQFMSAEFAIRPFIHHYPQQTMQQMLAWSHHEHSGVRRLASEGCRPRLPWGMGLPVLKADPSPILPILEHLKNDKSESVRRSVANNLNDISKDNPDLVIAVLQRWQTDNNDEIRQITSHALRTLIKQGHPAALEMLGYPSGAAIQIRNFVIEPEIIPFNGSLTFSFEIAAESNQLQDLIIDYVVHLLRANGQQTPKVFKLAKKSIQPGETLTIRKKHGFAPVTTRTYYPGEHALELKINGQLFNRTPFMLSEETE
ncbi:MAG: DNA alkylation repair protein [Ardenticatenaceae bacterium]|nr:DNA alkylation repair protein [Ardenticatenaceae bacterium]MCB9444455.1 DNA alkylation repair protein [Ardenticatenaceae bacterium]